MGTSIINTQAVVQPLVEKEDIEEVIEELVPRLSDDIEIYPFDELSYMIHQKKYDYRVRVTAMTYHLIQLIDGERNLEELAEIMNRDWEMPLKPLHIHKLLYKSQILECGIIQSDKEIVIRKGDTYLNLKIEFFPEYYLRKVSHLLGFLFTPKFFYISISTLLIILTGMFWVNIDWKTIYKTINPQNIFYFYGVFLTSALLHELGHATACRRFGAKHGAIGFGFYLFTPVFYADVSDAWKLKSSQRIIIDLAGIYMEVIFSSGLAITYIITGNMIYLNVSLLIILSTYNNLNPLLRFDGYWALSDGLNIPNLRANANQRVVNVFEWIMGSKTLQIKNKKDIFLLIYGLISWSFLVMFLTTVLIYNPQSLLYFPYNFVMFMKEIFTNFDNITFDWVKMKLFSFMLPLIFYYILWGFLRTRVIKLKDFIIQSFS
jgi:putative peptide zinc metalloprotease protein